MSDLGDVFRDMKNAGQVKRMTNKIRSTQILVDEGIRFVSKNNGTHLIISYFNKIVDFWPTTGLWRVRNGIKGRGIFNLIKHLGV